MAGEQNPPSPAGPSGGTGGNPGTGGQTPSANPGDLRAEIAAAVAPLTQGLTTLQNTVAALTRKSGGKSTQEPQGSDDDDDATIDDLDDDAIDKLSKKELADRLKRQNVAVSGLSRRLKSLEDTHGKRAKEDEARAADDHVTATLKEVARERGLEGFANEQLLRDAIAGRVKPGTKAGEYFFDNGKTVRVLKDHLKELTANPIFHPAPPPGQGLGTQTALTVQTADGKQTPLTPEVLSKMSMKERRAALDRLEAQRRP